MMDDKLISAEQPKPEPVACVSVDTLSRMFEPLDGIDPNAWGYHWRKGWNDALRRAMDYASAASPPAAAPSEADHALGYATRLATVLWEKHYKAASPHWRSLDSLMGVLTQIDNMTSGLAPPTSAPLNAVEVAGAIGRLVEERPELREVFVEAMGAADYRAQLSEQIAEARATFNSLPPRLRDAARIDTATLPEYAVGANRLAKHLRGHRPKDVAAAFEWLRDLATAEGAPPEAGIALDVWHAVTEAVRTAPPAAPSEAQDGELWSFLRSVMSQGADIHQDYIAGRHAGYEAYSARLDAAASDRVDGLRAALAAEQPQPVAYLSPAELEQRRYATSTATIPVYAAPLSTAQKDSQ